MTNGEELRKVLEKIRDFQETSYNIKELCQRTIDNESFMLDFLKLVTTICYLCPSYLDELMDQIAKIEAVTLLIKLDSAFKEQVIDALRKLNET